MTKPVITHNQFRHTGRIASAARQFGFEPNARFKTLDGDEARVIAIDEGHPFPLVGDIYDVENENTWLCRWNTLGHYEGTTYAQSRHSLRTNRVSKLEFPRFSPDMRWDRDFLKQFIFHPLRTAKQDGAKAAEDAVLSRVSAQKIEEGTGEAPPHDAVKRVGARSYGPTVAVGSPTEKPPKPIPLAQDPASQFRRILELAAAEGSDIQILFIG